MSTVARWQAYWENKSLPGCRYDDEEHYKRCGNELQVLFNGVNLKRVLEIGCGNGALYAYLGFDKCAQYLGIDFSQSMLNGFQERYPNVNLLCADGSAYRDDRQYDLIFSNGVLQHFDRAMIRQHFANARAMMTPSSLFICASIPWRALWFRYLTGELTGAEKPNWFRGALLRAMLTFKVEGMGYWYRLSDFKQFAREAGMTTSFYGSIYYPYRFHAVMKLA